MTREEARIKLIEIRAQLEVILSMYGLEISDVFDIAIEALEQEPKWISVSERLPEPKRLVLCYIMTGATETYFLAFWNDIQNAWEEGIGGCRLLENDLGYEVIAWMPLPEPYKAESEDKE